MEFEISNQNNNNHNNLRNSTSSINSNPELKDNKIFFLRILLIIINAISAILGYFIYKNKEYYLKKDYNFEYFYYLLIFIIIYSLGMLLTLIAAFILAIIIKTFFIILKSCSKNDNHQSLIKGEKSPSENSIRFINSNADEISIIPYTLTWFVVITSIIYFLSLPYSIFLLIFLHKDKTYSSITNFRILYSFLVINLIAGLILFYVILLVIFVKREGSLRKKRLSIDDKNLEEIKKEIKEAMQKAEQ